MSTKLWISIFYTLLSSAYGSQGSSNPCGHTVQVAHICNPSAITMTSKVFIYFSNLKVQNKTACTCTLSPNSPNVQVHLKYRQQTRYTENISFKINGMVLNETKTNASTTLPDTQELLLETSPIIDKEERVCLLLQTVNDNLLNISCGKAKSDVTASPTHYVTVSASSYVTASPTPDVTASASSFVTASPTPGMTDSTEINSRSTIPILISSIDSDGSLNSKNDDQTESYITGVIIGIIVVGVVVISLIIVAILFYRRRNVTKKKRIDTESKTKKLDVEAERNSGDDNTQESTDDMYQQPSTGQSGLKFSNSEIKYENLDQQQPETSDKEGNYKNVSYTTENNDGVNHHIMSSCHEYESLKRNATGEMYEMLQTTSYQSNK